MDLTLETIIIRTIDGANALKLDESYEIKSNEEQNALIDSFESNEENSIAEATLSQNNLTEEIPTGVSIESASYMENNSDIKIDETVPADNNRIENIGEEESIPMLFSDEQSQENSESKNLDQDDDSQYLFDQETNEDEDFEIPAFLRRQKF